MCGNVASNPTEVQAGLLIQMGRNTFGLRIKFQGSGKLLVQPKAPIKPACNLVGAHTRTQQQHCAACKANQSHHSEPTEFERKA